MRYVGKKSISSFLYVVIKLSIIVAFIGLFLSFLVYMFPDWFKANGFKSSFNYPGFAVRVNNATAVLEYPLVYISLWISGLIFIGILYCLKNIFKEFAKGKVFTDRNIRSMGWTGIFVLLFAVTSSFYDLFRGFMLASYFEDLSSEVELIATYRINPATVFVGLLILIYTAIFKTAKEYKEENDLTI
ncbi:DUF2975 domain-containing protein [Kosmotoga olearia]|uniref:DUF2975 domain-containing protein n=1 Tax=Kosmotoga olearia (strain ATCC BAA-1733 / DSM 21960 / TBF 19.5.1) TaxID=521045 RepID=C5CG97_KOSOT|nr:DUF2975 domain-containing protein [Kosmotoga olearia]ACR79538.1 hypothetical protein Kole_0828 [Kosmotoga olearia TBF 19.5.1]